MYSYDTVVEAINGLKSRGYTIDFNINDNTIVCSENKYCLKASEFEITEVHRFEGDSNPSDEDVVYGVESRDGKVKGVITSAFGLYADKASTEIIKKLSMHVTRN
jgi:hypothetical protein